jgi:hypothetical protein
MHVGSLVELVSSPQGSLREHVLLISIEICCSKRTREAIFGRTGRRYAAQGRCPHGRLHLSQRPHRCICVEIVRAHVLHMAGAKCIRPSVVDCEPGASFIVAANNANW